MAIALISLAVAAHQGWSANLFTTASDMFPRSAVGSVVGIGATIGSIGGMLFSPGAEWILNLTHNYDLLFLISASAYVVGLGLMSVIAPGFKPASLAQSSA